jgi:dTDP-4-amino-4,6-dideoxygalactose transaminase
MIYYPVPGHRQKMFAAFQTEACSLPVTDLLTEQVISLPIHTELDQEQLSCIEAGVLDFFKS